MIYAATREEIEARRKASGQINMRKVDGWQTLSARGLSR
jgi:hypothetical protein